MSTFQRARSDEQREIRRRTILDTAATMLAESSVAEISLNELARRVGLAKSNVLRYFESREAVLLDLLVSLAQEFFAETAERISAVADDESSGRDRAAAVAAILATGFGERPMMCELLSAQAAVLERNVSAETVTEYKRTGYASMGGFATALRAALPELDEAAALEATRMIVLLVGTLWTHSHPPRAVLDAYAADPTLIFLPEGFTASVEGSIRTVLVGLLAQA